MAAAGYGVGKNCYPEKVNITAHIEYLMAKDPVLRERFGIQKEVPKYEPVIEEEEEKPKFVWDIKADPRVYIVGSKKMPSTAALVPPDIDFDSKEPWTADAQLIIPIEKTQVLIHESAVILGAQAFLNIAKLPYQTSERTNAGDISPNGKLPVVRCGAYVVSELEGIVQLVQAKGLSLSENLNLNQKADLRAYMSLVHNVLGNALLYFSWLDKDVYNNITRFRVGSVYNFPLTHLVPWYQRRRVSAQLKTLNWGERTSEEVYREVETCLLALSERLADEKYFFCETVTELDALVFGYLFTMITTPLSNNQLGNIVKQQPNLVKFCRDMENTYFNHSYLESIRTSYKPSRQMDIDILQA